MASRRVVVVGDPVLDVYLNGFTDRISREAPVLIVQEESRDHRLGGAANTAANLASLGADVTLVGFVGPDAEGEILARLVLDAGIAERLVPRLAGNTVTKTRVMAGGRHIRKQQMLRIDRASNPPPTPEAVDALRRDAQAALDDAEALVVSDYGDPSLTDVYVGLAQAARRDGRVVVVDSRRALLRFDGVSAVTPNVPEVEALLGEPVTGGDDALVAARHLTERLHLDAAVITRGQEGMAVVDRTGACGLVPAVGGEAVDVTGAGDTVTAAFTLALLAGAPALEAAHIANYAASITVQRVGTSVCSPAALLDRVRAP